MYLYIYRTCVCIIIWNVYSIIHIYKRTHMHSHAHNRVPRCASTLSTSAVKLHVQPNPLTLPFTDTTTVPVLWPSESPMIGQYQRTDSPNLCQLSLAVSEIVGLKLNRLWRWHWTEILVWHGTTTKLQNQALHRIYSCERFWNGCI